MIEEVAVCLEDCAIDVPDAVGGQPEAGLGGTEYAVVLVGILQVDPAHRLPLDLLDGCSACLFVDERVLVS